jgi:hypothetical protein
MIRNFTHPVKTPSEYAAEMGEAGYRIQFFGEGEAIVTKPDGETRYFVSLTGETFELGCTCIAGQRLGRCKHVAVVANFRPCDNPGCTGVQEYRPAVTCFGETVNRFECLTCGKTTDPRIAYETRARNRRNRNRPAA